LSIRQLRAIAQSSAVRQTLRSSVRIREAIQQIDRSDDPESLLSQSMADTELSSLCDAILHSARSS
jgi:hypothetical protein